MSDDAIVSSGESSGETIESAPVVETPAAKERRMLEAKVNGKTLKVSEDDLLREYSKFSSADEKFREAAQIRKENQAFEQRMIDDPESFMRDSRIPKETRRAIAEKILMESLEEEMSPQKTAEQRRIEELEAENEQFKSRDHEEMTKREQAEFQKVVETRREAIAKTFQDALALSPLSKDEGTSAEVVREMASYMRLCSEAGHSVTPQELASHVETRFMNSYKSLTDNLSGEDLVGFLGKSIIKKLREYDLGQLESRRNKSEPDTAKEWTRETTQKREFVDPRSLIRK
jgi:hypothetical protein